jgi:hypothetical protein
VGGTILKSGKSSASSGSSMIFIRSTRLAAQNGR